MEKINNLVIRGYQSASDKDAVARITRAAWHGVSLMHLFEQRFGVLGGVPWQDFKEREIVNKCEGHPELTLVAEVDSLVVGYATYGISSKGDVGVVGENAVDPAWQRRGIGKALVSRTIEIMLSQGVKMLHVETFEHDLPARKVYEHMGFELIAKSVVYTMSAKKATEVHQKHRT